MNNKIAEQFNSIAKEYDINREKFIPCFNDYYIKTTDFLTHTIEDAHSILDLGAGTGLLSSFWYKYFPNAKYVLVDIAEDMLDVAKRRFDGIENVTFENMNYINELPCGTFDVIISALSIHHLDNNQKKSLFSKIYDKLLPGGIFINYDQFCADTKKIDNAFNSYWEEKIYNSGLTKEDIERWKTRRLLDKECSVSSEIKMLKETNFNNVNCIFSNQKFSVIYADK